MPLERGAPESVGVRSEQLARARDLCAEWVQDRHTPSLGVCVARRGVIVLEEAFGLRKPGDDTQPLELDAIHPLMSLTKPFIGVLIMQLVEDGLLGLNRPMVEYLPELEREETRDILVHHLLTHTSGWQNYDGPVMAEHAVPTWRANPEFPPCPDKRHHQVHQMLHLFGGAPLAHPPGRYLQYSDFNYLLLGEIVSAVSGRSLEHQAQLRLFEPLGMKDTYFVLPQELYPRVAERPPQAYLSPSHGPFMRGIDSDQFRAFPGGGDGLLSTARDLLAFGQAILDAGRIPGSDNARILSRAAVEAMVRDQNPTAPAVWGDTFKHPASWGYGWMIEAAPKWKYFLGSLSPLGTICHPGRSGGKLWIDREREVVGVYLEAVLNETEDGELLWKCDLFENAVNAAIEL